MKVKFIGATNGITGSCSWLKHSETDTQWLVDCGMNQGPAADTKNMEPFLFDSKKINGVLLTHAHIDHCGLIPKLYKEGFTGKVYCTKATADIARIQLKAAVKHLISPLFSGSDVDSIQWAPFDIDERFKWGYPVGIAQNITATPMRGSHMLGACAIQLSWKVTEKRWNSMLFTGDVGNNTEDHTQFPMLKGNHAAFPSANYILIESTYGAKVREEQYRNMEDRHSVLWNSINETINEKHGKVVIPVFAAQRAQDVLLDCIIGLCNKSISKPNEEPVRILVHSPSVAKLNSVYADQLEKTFWSKKGEKQQYLNTELQRLLTPSQFTRFIDLLKTKKDGRGVLVSHAVFGIGEVQVHTDPTYSTHGYDIIIASSGMSEGGYIVNHLNQYQDSTENSILITGYQASGTRGSYICNNPEAISAEVINLSAYYSGHADQKILLDFLFDTGGYTDQVSETTVFLNHGEYLSKGSFAEEISIRSEQKNPSDREINEVITPGSSETWFDLNKGEFDAPKVGDLFKQIADLKRQLENQNTRT